MNIDSIILKSYDVFKEDLGNKKKLNLHRGDDLYYNLNNIDYTIAEFWHYFEKYQIEKVESIIDYGSKVTYLKRIISQINTVKHCHYRSFLGTPTPLEVCNDVNFYADLIIKSFQCQLDEIERYDNENKKKEFIEH